MELSVSHIKLHMVCPMKAYFREVERIGSSKLQPALEVGTLAHAAFAAKLGGLDWRVETDALIADSELPLTDDGQKILKTWYGLAPALDVWAVPDDFKVKNIEHELAIPLGRHVLRGRLDTIVEWNGADWHLQHKTLSPSTPPETYEEQQQTDWHESVYQRMMEVAGFKPMGTALNIIRKLSATTIAKDPHAALVPIRYLVRSNETIEAALADLEQIADDIEAGIEGKRRIIQNRSACGGMFNNALCEYKNICDGYITADDPSFVKLENRYGSLGNTDDSSVV